MSQQPDKQDEIIKRLSDLAENLDDLCERFDTEISAVRQEIDRATKAATDAPNRTGTILEQNQQTIFKAVCQNRDLLKSVGAQIEEITDEQEPQTKPE